MWPRQSERFIISLFPKQCFGFLLDEFHSIVYQKCIAEATTKAKAEASSEAKAQVDAAIKERDDALARGAELEKQLAAKS